MILSSLDARRTILTHHIIEQLIQLFHDHLIRLDIDGVKHILRLDPRIFTRVDNANTVRFLTEHLSNASHHHVERYLGHFLFLCPIVLLFLYYSLSARRLSILYRFSRQPSVIHNITHLVHFDPSTVVHESDFLIDGNLVVSVLTSPFEQIGSKSNTTNQSRKAGVVQKLSQLSHSVQNDQVFHFLVLLFSLVLLFLYRHYTNPNFNCKRILSLHFRKVRRANIMPMRKLVVNPYHIRTYIQFGRSYSS